MNKDEFLSVGFLLLISLIIYIPVRLIVKKVLKKKNIQNTMCHEAAFFVFYAYIFFLVFQCLTPNFVYSSDNVFISFDKTAAESNNFVPFSLIFTIFGFAGNISDILKEYLPHLLIFIPLGLLSGLLWDRYKKFIPSLILGLFVSIFGEAVQIFTYRCADIDEAVLHTASFIFGWLLLKLILKICPDYSCKFTYKTLSVHNKK